MVLARAVTRHANSSRVSLSSGLVLWARRQACVWILIPVVVAVLVDNFSMSCRAEEEQAIIDEENERMKRLGISKAKAHSPIQPLLESLSKFKNSEDLGNKIQSLFKVGRRGFSLLCMVSFSGGESSRGPTLAGAQCGEAQCGQWRKSFREW
mmetsp:Transcript_75976/g.203715  ORF Transcript_75976/g.203715 Transcript_75976/m.203715 type:complete len:152 (-) Transcript_75976:1130-1585(-)